MAPLLSFTAEESCSVVKRKSVGRFFTESFSLLPAPVDGVALIDKWTRLRAVRADVQKKLEPLRERGEIGSSLQAEVEVRTNAETAALLQTLGDELKFLLITSSTRVTQVDDSTDQQIIVTPSGDTKCGRCWHWRADVGCDADHPTICGRCVSNLFGAGESRMFV